MLAILIYLLSVLVHPCDRKDNGGCSHKCVTTEAEEEEEVVGYKCVCPKGFVLEEDMKTCEMVHPCDRPNKGGCQHICTKDANKAICSCKKGFTLEEDGQSCEEGKRRIIEDLKLLIAMFNCISYHNNSFQSTHAIVRTKTDVNKSV